MQADRREKRERRGGHTDDQEPDSETTELLTLIEKYPAVILTLLVRTRDPNQELGFKKLATLNKDTFKCWLMGSIVSHPSRTIC